MSEARQVWEALSLPWQVAFDEAWASWCQGSLGVGAAIADGTAVLARGHNQFFHAGPGPISTTTMAHAEMNALAQLPVGSGTGCDLYSTFEPCFMCTSALHLYRIDRVHFASFDPVWAGMGDWLQSAPWAHRRDMQRQCLGGVLGALGYALHVSRLVDIAPPSILDIHRYHVPQFFELAANPALVNTLSESMGTACAGDALEGVWELLVGVSA